MARVPVVRAFRLPIIAATVATALSGCIQTARPVAVAQPQRDLDSIAYGRSYAMSAAPAAYAAAPVAAAYDKAYRLDAGDKLRVVVYGQDGLTNAYAIDAGGSITMPLIGAVPARGRTPAGLAAEITARLPRSLGGGGDRILPSVLHPRRSRSARSISLRSKHECGERGRDRGRIFAARAARSSHADPHRQFRFGARTGAAWKFAQSRRYCSGRRALVLGPHYRLRLAVLLAQMPAEEAESSRPGDIGARFVIARPLVTVETVLRARIHVDLDVGPLGPDDVDIAERDPSVLFTKMKLGRDFRLVIGEAHDGAAVIADRGRQA